MNTELIKKIEFLREEGKKWVEIAIELGFKCKNTTGNKSQYHQNLRRKVKRFYENYYKELEKFELYKRTYYKGELNTETYRKKTLPKHKTNKSSLKIKGVTTNPYGGEWVKYYEREKEKLFDKKHFNILKTILSQNIKPYTFKVKSQNKCGLFIYGSDKHIGAVVKENSIYKNLYNQSEIYKRIVYNTIDQIEYWLKSCHTFDALYVMDLGDALDGYNNQTTRGGHHLPQELNNREQHDIYVKIHKELFDIIVTNEYAEKIYFISTANSNHGGDFEYCAMKTLETYLNVKYPQIQTVISVTHLNHFIYGQHCIIFSHGKDTEDMKAGLPLVLNDKIKNYINEYITINKLNDYFITFVSGDKHQSAETYTNKFRYLQSSGNAANFRKFIEIYTKDIQKVLAACSIKKNTCDNEEVCKSCSE